MLNYIIIAGISYLLGIVSVILYSIFKISSKCSELEENIIDKQDYGQIVYDEIEKKEKETCKKK